MNLPEAIENEDQLDDVLSQPSEPTCEIVSRLEGDVVVLGAGGKIGPTFCRLLRKAGPKKTIYAIDAKISDRLKQSAVKTIAADLLDRSSYETLPKAPNVYYLAGMKFGASADQPLTWAVNTYLPALPCEYYRDSRIVAFSTGNVYPFVDVAGGGATEETLPDPKGEYAQSCLGRERIFQHFSKKNNTAVCLIRLNYANEPRYGVIVDVTRKILADEPIDVTMGFVNLIWQGDANDYIARAITLAESPARILNVTNPETISIRYLAEQVGSILNRTPKFIGNEAPTALLSNAGECFEAFGYPRVPLLSMVRTIVRWVTAGKPMLDKPTKFQVRDGKY